MTEVKKVQQLIDIAIKASIKAGNAILKVYYNENFNVELKSDNSPLTIADKRAHEVIEEDLLKTNLPILSEEGKDIPFNVRKEWETFWLVDPLDGTKEFIKRNDEFTVNIALIHKCQPIGGVVYVPVTGEMFWSDGEKSFKAIVTDTEHVKFEEKVTLPILNEKNSFVVVGSRSHMSTETEDYINTLDTGGKPIEIVSKGSSLKLCMVAEGNANVYPRLAPTMEWDTAAGNAVALTAGKLALEYHTMEPLIYNKENLLNPWFVIK